MSEESFEKYEQDYIKEHTTTIHGYTEKYVKKLQQENKTLKENAENNDKVVDKVNWENRLLKQENQQLKEQLLDETKNNYKLKYELEKQRKEYQETYKDVREEIKDYKNQLKQRDEVIDELENFYFINLWYLTDDDKKCLEEILQKYKGENNE